ncbi:cupin domain-containing protein [Paenibacillus sp.]|uniref:cupin domain-containing protein n=1 Tax=Paenibacillus sp. TaxID=58172 RepID=UPI002831D93A|nr:cupin domain-containing protein [Paenibacillus sp.]MDR0269974.1 cupin domain-containing protein [Paenibacillus sp.]
MKIYNFGSENGKDIHAYGSKQLVMTRILSSSADLQTGCMHLGPNGVVSYHQATTPQLFLVISGEGFVKGYENEEQRIQAGSAAFWEAGEWHETRTEHGLSAIVIEGISMNIYLE